VPGCTVLIYDQTCVEIGEVGLWHETKRPRCGALRDCRG
jgi:hypothetical protein